MAVHLLQLSDPPARVNTASAADPTRADERSSSTSTGEAEFAAKPATSLHALIAYEAGHLALFRFAPTSEFEEISLGHPGGQAGYHRPRDGKLVGENEGWDLVWAEKGHRDAGESAVLFSAIEADEEVLPGSRRSS